MSFIDFVEVLECIAGAGKTAFRRSTCDQAAQLIMLELPLFGIQNMVDDVYTLKTTADYRESVLTADICHREITRVTGTG
jgi:hypothetical protein